MNRQTPGWPAQSQPKPGTATRSTDWLGHMSSALRLIATSLIALACGALAQAAVTVPYLQGLRPVAADQVTTLGPSLFGDKINLFSGSLGFEQTDTSLPGNNALPVAVTRRHDAGREEFLRGAFGDWDVAVPSIGGMFARVDGWVTATGSQLRCSEFSMPPHYYGFRPGIESPVPHRGNAGRSAPPTPWRNGSGRSPMEFQPDDIITFLPTDFWQGTYLNVPGAGSQEVLKRIGDHPLVAHDAFGVPQPNHWKLLTHQHWQIACLPSLRNGPGEGFIAKAPDGTEYTFDWMIRRGRDGVNKQRAILDRDEVQIVATLVRDRFGNTVRYHYDNTAHDRLLKIESSDGRVISFTWVGGRVDEVFDGTRRFRYRYDSAGRLLTLTQPDGSQWSFNLAGLRYPYPGEVGEFARCNFPGMQPNVEMVGEMTHPSGAKARFVTRFEYHGRTDVLKACIHQPGTTAEFYTTGSMFPRVSLRQTMSTKTITGPGLPDMTWRYSFAGPSSWSDCTTCSNHIKTVTVTDPAMNVSRHHYGVRWRKTEGQLLGQEEGWTTAGSQRRTDYTYRAAGTAPYALRFGASLMWDWDGDRVSSTNLPMETKVVRQQGETFTWAVDHPNAAAGNGFDEYARPIHVKRYRGSGSSNAIREETKLRDDHRRWVLGQPLEVKDKDSNQVIESTEYDEATSMPKAEWAFGLKKRSFSFRSDGTLAWVANEGGHKTWFDNWTRGSPQKITYADGAVEQQELNNLGQPRWIDNAEGTRHSYLYDSMGRVARVSYPPEPDLIYHPTVLTYSKATAADRGLAIGHWRQVSTTGKARVTRLFDGFWRERIRITEDTDSPETTQSIVETRYDHDGRKTFVSYPMRPVGGVYAVGDSQEGQFTTYDALGRPTLQRATSELGNLDTTTEYLPGFKRKVTNPRNHSTTTLFQAFDQPSEDHIVEIQAPEGVTLAIERDRYGKARRITRSGTHAGLAQSLTRRYVYDGHQRLCTTIEPETRATVQEYDAAGNVAWKASGQTLQDESACSHSGVPEEQRVRFGYDNRGRPTTTTYGDNSQSIARTYTRDGLLARIETRGASLPTYRWTYSYNQRRLLSREVYNWGNSTHSWTFGRDYDQHGNVSAQVDPWGAIPHAPDALGQPTQVGDYVTQVRHHPNGMVSGYRYGTAGLLHQVSLNQRGLPLRWTHGSLVNDVYSYDLNGNVTEIRDDTTAAAHRSMPDYDGLDRLRQAHGPWGQGYFSYDALDNLTRSAVGSRTLEFGVHPATNQLTTVTGSQSFSIAYDDIGNVKMRNLQAFDFDLGNRLQSASGKASYAYDGHGRRTQVIPESSVHEHTYAYTMDGKLRYSWQSSMGGGKRYVYLGDHLVAEHLSTGARTYVHTDALGSPVVRTNSAGAVLSRTRYEPYGATLAGSTNPNGIGFTGHVNDPDTGLVYMQQRYYDPIAGRFLSVDPVTTNAKDGSFFGRYHYANSNPYKYLDPDGQAPVPNSARDPIGAGVGGGGMAPPGVGAGRGPASTPVGSIRATDKAAADPAGAYKKYTPGGNFSKKTKADTAERANHTCEYCGTKTVPAKKSESGVTPPKNEGQTDHVVPKSAGGTNAPSNAAHSCRGCNREMSSSPKPHPRDKQDAN